ncbi:adenine phosphoribosyltransferase [Maribacter sp. 2307ULW6-5]|uniref:adenine phosphoribosyltransferase n=1 Tax=Maribacter sp. 2307ULW6-5 TaxID=3386275 RepID=UPI0039BD91BA
MPIPTDFNAYIKDVANFPKPGVVFKDISPLLQDGPALRAAILALKDLVNGAQIDKVVGMESRGFILGPALALELRAGFVPVRKAGKLPRKTIRRSFALEYGEDVLELHQDAIQEGDRILIHDDVLATGGTARAVQQMVQELGGKIVQFNFLIELQFLKGIEQLPQQQVAALLKY